MLNSTRTVVELPFLQTESCFWLSEWHKTKSPYIQLYRSTICLKITSHKYAQVQDSQCIAHLWQNWVLAVKTNGHGSHEVPNYLILKKKKKDKKKKGAGKQKQILPRYCAYRSLIFRLVTNVRGKTWGTEETDWDLTSMLNSGYMFGFAQV